MFSFSGILRDLQAAIAVVSARERNLTALLVAVWGRIGRIGTRLERLIALWRAGCLPAPRSPQARPASSSVRAKSVFPTVPGWLLVAVRDAGAFGSQLEHLLTQAECAEFLAAVPQARRILRPLCRMLGVGVAARAARRPRAVWVAPRALPVLVVQAGLVVGPGGRLIHV